MKTKSILNALLAFCVGCCLSATTSCSSDNDPFFTASENDAPRILNTDRPEGSGSDPAVIKTITRTENFTFEVMVTPVNNTTVTWFIDDVQVAEGLKIDVPVKTGDHIVKIVATTTKGLSTSRTCKLIVQPAAEDPVPGTNIYDRLVIPGSAAQLHGTNMSKVVKVIIGGTSVNATYNAAEDCVEYTVPNLPDGIYALEVADAEGNVFGAGQIELNANPEYPAQGGEKTIWEGSFDVTWGTPFNALQAEFAGMVEAGTILRVYVTGNGQGAATTAWWRNIITGISNDDEPGGRGDITISGDMVLEYTLTDLSISLLNEQDGFLIVGDGYTLTKITIEQPVETALWEGSFAVTWGTPFDGLKTELINHVKAGTILRAYVTGNGQGTAATAWWRNIVTGISDDDEPGGRGDIIIDGDAVLEYTLTDLSIQLLQEQDGFLMVGDGYTLLKITVE